MIALGLYPDPDAVMGVEACGVVIETSLNKGIFRGRRPGNGPVPRGHRNRRQHRPAAAGQGAGGGGRTRPPPPPRWCSPPPTTRWWIWPLLGRASAC
ncbi:hypothetical protein ACQKB3_20930 [Mycobacterium tuberculosis]